SVLTKERYPVEYATTEYNMGIAYAILAKVENRAENCKKAIECYQEALSVLTKERYPVDYATTQNNMGIAYAILAKVENRAENCKKACQAFNEALTVFTEENFPQIHQMIVENKQKLMRTCENIDEP
ncbi:MAG: tetratricopeptide repeat protein, partial [Thermoplasmata archaeon]